MQCQDQIDLLADLQVHPLLFNITKRIMGIVLHGQLNIQASKLAVLAQGKAHY